MYLLLIDMYIKDLTKKTHLLWAIKTISCIQRKAKWALKWCNSTAASFAKRMITFAAVKSIYFSGFLLCHLLAQKCALMPGLCSSNELIAKRKG